MNVIRSLESLEVMLDHIDIALLVLESFFLDRLIACLHDLHLLYVCLSDSFKSFLQEVPKDEVYQPIYDEHCPIKRLWEHTQKSIISR